MGLSTETFLASSNVLQAKINTALIGLIDSMLPTPSTPDLEKLVNVVLQNPARVLGPLTTRLTTVDKIDLDSSDAEISTAITASVTFMLWQTQILPGTP